MTGEEWELRNKKRGILLFKFFIQFLEIYGQENFGENVEINWPGVYETCNSFGMFDFNYDLEEIIFSEDEETFRDNAFKWIETQVLDGYPIWRLYILNNWLFDQLEKEFHKEETRKNKEYFNACKCLTCKYYHDYVEYFDKYGVAHKYNEGKGDYKPVPKNANLIHHVKCLKRDQLQESYEKKMKDITFNPDENHFKYKKFNLNYSDQEGNSKWCLYVNTETHKNCPYYDKDEKMTYNKFIKKYGEILR